MTSVNQNVGMPLSRGQEQRIPPGLEERIQPIPATLRAFSWGVCAIDHSVE